VSDRRKHINEINERKGIDMTKRRNQHVVKTPDGRWGVKSAGGSRFTSAYDTQAEAISRGKEIAQNQKSELFIHGRNGQIRERNSYGNDSCPPKG